MFESGVVLEENEDPDGVVLEENEEDDAGVVLEDNDEHADNGDDKVEIEQNIEMAQSDDRRVIPPHLIP